MFDITQVEFILCSIELIVKDGCVHFAVVTIDSNNSVVKVCQFVDNEFFLALENILIQVAPNHEDTKFYVLAHVPLDFYAAKINSILEKLGICDQKEVLVNSKEYSVGKKNLDPLSSIKLLLVDDEKEYQMLTSIFYKEEFLLALATLNNTINFTKMLQHVHLQNKFKMEKLNTKAFLNFDLTCLKCLNLFDNFEDRKVYSSGASTITKNLPTGGDKSSAKTSVFSILNLCCTKFGTRTLRNWLLQPLQDVKEINTRLSIVELFLSSMFFKNEVRLNFLSKIDDIQTVNLKLTRYTSTKDENILKLSECVKLQNCIAICKNLLAYLKCYEGVNIKLFFERYVGNLEKLLLKLTKLEEMLSKTIVYDATLKDYVINPNLNSDLANLKEEMDQLYNEVLGIKEECEAFSANKKVKVTEYLTTGFCLEMNKSDGDNLLKGSKNGYKLISSNKTAVIVNTMRLSEISAQTKLLRNEYKQNEKVYLKKILDVTASYHSLLENLTFLLSELDILSSFATMVQNSKETYSKPIIHETGKKLILKDSRHLILEWNESIIKKNNPNNKNLIANDCELDENANIKLITGINMGGKSTYLRQIGICVLLAHIGCYLPCSFAEVSIVDQIFTRVGAGDMMLKGISTYMNEMIEVCSLIKSATAKSLVLIDELGRGTSTDDGIGISYGILNYLSTVLNCNCLFATHFFELTEMENVLKNVGNYYVSYSVSDGELMMEYKILKGKTNNSFGVNLFKSMKFDEDTCEALERFLNEQI